MILKPTCLFSRKRFPRRGKKSFLKAKNFFEGKKDFLKGRSLFIILIPVSFQQKKIPSAGETYVPFQQKKISSPGKPTSLFSRKRFPRRGKSFSRHSFSPEREISFLILKPTCLFSRKRFPRRGKSFSRHSFSSPEGKKKFFERKFTLRHPHSCLHSRQMPTRPEPFLPPKLHPQCR